MKLLLTSLFAASASAFVHFAPSGLTLATQRRQATALSVSELLRLDSSKAIQAALDASKQHGVASPEASVLWDIVEEMDSADNSDAFNPVAIADEEYADKVKALSQLLGVKMTKTTSSSTGSGSEDSAMKAALAAARSAAEAHGKDSVEAKLAWEKVEEIASSNNLEATRAPLDEGCLIELIEGCEEALEKFKTALEYKKMGLTVEQVSLVQTSWAKCIPIADIAADLFYDKLFELDPALRPLFPADLADQKKKLMVMLTFAVDGLTSPSKLVPKVQGLGARHTVHYKVTAPMFDTVGAALLDTFEKGLGDSWDAEHKEAWTLVFGVLSKTMIDAGDAAVAAA